MKLSYLGHSAVRIETDAHEILIDPFLADNPTAAVGPADVEPDFIVLTHAHGDHVGDTVDIARRTGATLLSSVEICSYLGARGVAATHGMNIGGPFAFPFGRLQFTPAWHSSSFADGSYGGMPMGVVLEIDGRRLYHAGDTGLFGDMKLIGARGLDLALLPIGGHFTMGPEEALQAVELLEPAQVVPIHYDTFDVIRQDAEAFVGAVDARTRTQGVLLPPGGTLEL